MEMIDVKAGKKRMTEKEFPVLYTEKDECCGCSACYAICPKKAIAMVIDEEGFEYPQVDRTKCIKCYTCVSVCPLKKLQSAQVSDER